MHLVSRYRLGNHEFRIPLASQHQKNFLFARQRRVCGFGRWLVESDIFLACLPPFLPLYQEPVCLTSLYLSLKGGLSNGGNSNYWEREIHGPLPALVPLLNTKLLRFDLDLSLETSGVLIFVSRGGGGFHWLGGGVVVTGLQHFFREPENLPTSPRNP